MSILNKFTALLSGKEEKEQTPALTERIVLGALLSLVAKADGSVSEDEEQVKRAILAKRGYQSKEEQDEIFKISRQVIAERLDWEGFTREVNKACEYQDRVRLVEDLFTVAWADHELTNGELETIRKISDLMWIEHKDFINAKINKRP